MLKTGMDLYLINLARRPDRLASMQAQAERLGLRFTRLEALDARDADPAAIDRWFRGGGPLGEIPRGDKCCSLSHRMAWEKLVASGAPYWRRFRHGWLIGAAYALAPWLAALVGHLPGRRIGFGGNEARGVIADWARSGRSGRYAAAGMKQDFERLLAALQLPVLALRLRQDWLGPPASLAWLLGKLGPGARRVETISRDDLDGAPADHFGWMKTPAPVASRIADWLGEADATFVARGDTAA